MREPTDPFLASKPKLSQIPFQPWARALFANRVQIRNEPYVRCKPSSGARQVATAYGTQLLEDRELKRFYIFETGGAHSFRTIYMDGRAHPANLSPSYRGHSVGHWEGDTLVVDTVGFNEGVWIDNLGMPTTEQLHTIERFTRTDFNTIRYEITVDDPGAYTAPWKSGLSACGGRAEMKALNSSARTTIRRQGSSSATARRSSCLHRTFLDVCAKARRPQEVKDADCPSQTRKDPSRG